MCPALAVHGERGVGARPATRASVCASVCAFHVPLRFVAYSSPCGYEADELDHSMWLTWTTPLSSGAIAQ